VEKQTVVGLELRVVGWKWTKLSVRSGGFRHSTGGGWLFTLDDGGITGFLWGAREG
jgi:hypothetical protein